MQDFKPGNTFVNHLGKFIGGGLGWGIAGPLGALVGLGIGSVIDKIKNTGAAYGDTDSSTTRGDFKMSLLVLIAAIMKADGSIRRAELDYVKRFLVQNFGEDETREALIMLRDLLKKEIRIQPICEQIRDNMNYPLRLQLMYFLTNLAFIDEHFAPAEERLLFFIAGRLGIRPSDRASIWAMFHEREQEEAHDYRQDYRQPRSHTAPSALDRAYSVLGVSRSADAETVKKAYRTMAVQYHPDKVAYLGEDLRKAANEKFQRLNEAYELVKKDKGIV